MEIKKIKLLAIDDNRDNLITLKAMIKDAFPEIIVFTALNGKIGIVIAVEEDPDVILLDVIMPEMDGFEVCRKLKANSKLSEIPVVFVTAIKDDKESRILALECGAEAFLTKPIDSSELKAQIRAMIKIKAANNWKSDQNKRLSKLVKEKTIDLEILNNKTLKLLYKLKIKNEELQKNAGSLKAAQSLAQLGNWEFDHTINKVEWSDMLFKIFEISSEGRGLSYREFLRVVYQEDRKRIICAWHDARNNHSLFEVTYRLQMKDGRIKWVNERVETFFDIQGQPVKSIGAMQDITERKQADIELRQTKDYLDNLFNHASASIIVWNENLEITKFNGSAENLIGRKADEVLGKSIKGLFPISRMSSRLKRFIAESGRVKNLGNEEIDIINTDGSVRTVLCNLATAFDQVGSSTFSTIVHGQDITERKKAEENLIYLSYHDQLTGLYNRRFFEEELERLDIKRNLPLTIVMGDINGLKLINDSFGHAIGDEILKSAAEIFKYGYREDDVIARIGGDEFAIILSKTDTIETQKIVKRIKEHSINYKVSNVGIELSISLGYDTKVKSENKISEILENAENNMYRHKIHESSSMRSKTIDIIMNTLFEKSVRESDHSKRVSAYCQAIATKMNLDNDSVGLIRIAGLVHDIGKIGVDEKILNKSESLNNDEWEEIKKHSEIGWRILSESGEYSELANFILNHHERWDGGGYPNGIRDEKIPLESRIISVADAFDAMTSVRNYKKGISQEAAIDELKRCSGMHFDPKITDVFINYVLPWMEKIII